MRIPFIPNTVILLLLVLAGTTLYALRAGYVSNGLIPLPAVDLESGSGMFLDWRIAALAQDRDACAIQVLASPLVSAKAVPDASEKPGCYWINAVTLETSAGAQIGASPLSCPMAAAFTLWVAHVVQPEAERAFGSRVKAIADFGTYSCRAIIGGFFQKYAKYLRQIDESMLMSEHATANAIDVSAFTLENGESISVERNFRDGGTKGAFLHAIHDGACSYFRVVLGPDANKEHYNHFHLDRGFLRACR